MAYTSPSLKNRYPVGFLSGVCFILGNRVLGFFYFPQLPEAALRSFVASQLNMHILRLYIFNVVQQF